LTYLGVERGKERPAGKKRKGPYGRGELPEAERERLWNPKVNVINMQVRADVLAPFSGTNPGK